MNKPSGNLGRETVGLRRARLKRQQVKRLLSGRLLLVGLDLGKKRHAAWFADSADLAPIRRFMLDHSHEGMAKLLVQAEHDREARDLEGVVVFFEATSSFWQNVAKVLDTRGVPYRTVSSLSVARQREIEHLTYAKGDYRDAALIVRLGANGQWLHRTLETSSLWLQLRALALEHEVMLDAEKADKNRVRSLLELACPELLECFADPLKQTARALLKRLTHSFTSIPSSYTVLADQAAQVTGYRLQRSKIRRLIALLQARPSFGVEETLPSTLARVGYAVQRYELLHEQRQDIRAKLVELYDTTPYRQVLDTIPGVTPENQALLLGLIGDPARYDRATCLVKLAGIEPRENHSGMAQGSSSISHRGTAALRAILHRIVMGAMLGNPELKAYMKRIRQRPKNPLAYRQATVATANKYLRIVYRLCISGQPYNPSRLTGNC